MFRLYESWRATTHYIRIHRTGCAWCQDGTAAHPDTGGTSGRWIPRSGHPPIDAYRNAVAVATHLGAQVVESCETCQPERD